LRLRSMQVYDAAECFTGRLYSIGNEIMMRMYAIDSIAIYSVDDDDDDFMTDHQKVGDAFHYKCS
jgi:hypothetical protein